MAKLTHFDRFCVAIFDLNKRIEAVKGEDIKRNDRHFACHFYYILSLFRNFLIV